MKYLKYLLYLVVIVAAIFFAKGLLTPSISYENEIVVNKAAPEAWAVMEDPASLPKWIDGYKRMEHVSGTPNTIGAVSNVYVDEQGSEMVMQETITALQTNERMAMTFTMDFMDMDYDISFKETDGKTKITSKSMTKGNGIIAKSLISFMKGAMRDQEDENLANLKKLIEENTKDYFPKTVTVDTLQVQ